MPQESDGIRPSTVSDREHANLAHPLPVHPVQRDVLAMLSARRIDIGEIKFVGKGFIGQGGMGDVVVATIIPKEGSSSESKRIVAVKKLHLGGHSDEEKFLRVSRFT